MKLLNYDKVLNLLGNGRIHLLLGNGFSIACDPIFSYNSLYDIAKKDGLSKQTVKVFENIGTNNFEGVLRLLDNALWISKIYYQLGDEGSAISSDIEIIKQTLIKTIAYSHLEHSGKVSDEAKSNVLKFINPFHNVFTTNYDLLLYWVNMYSNPIRYEDGFRAEQDDPDSDSVVFTEHLGNNKGILFLHGALHLYLDNYELRKHCWSRTQRPLLELIREGLDNKRYPLFVAEGNSDKKMEQINSSPYLSYCLGKLGRIQNKLVVFGHTLGQSDYHIVKVLAANTGLTEIYVGLYKNATSKSSRETILNCNNMIAIRDKMIKKSKRISPLRITYYDSSTINVWGN